MAASSGTSAKLSIDNGGGALTDISAALRNIKFTRGAKTVDVATLGASNDAPFGTLKNGTISGDGVWDAATDAIFDAGLGFNTRSFQLDPAGTGAGLVRYTGELVITSYDASPPIDGVTMFTFSALVTGGATRAVQ
jgi:hypothetical protein